MGSQYREILEEKKHNNTLTSRQQLEDLDKQDIKDRPIWDTGLENLLFGLQDRYIYISTGERIVAGQVEGVEGYGYNIAFTISGKKIQLFNKNKKHNIYNIMDRSTHDCVYENEHPHEPVVVQIAYALGKKYAEEYVYNQEHPDTHNESNVEINK